MSTGEERQKIEALRAELQANHTVSRFHDAKDLATLVTAAVSRLHLERKEPKLGPLVSKMCDRFPQVREFWKFFQATSRDCPGRPQFYFIHGDKGEGHDSLLERLICDDLKRYAEKKWGREYATIYGKDLEVTWPKQGNLSERQDELRFNLRTRFDKWGEDTGFTAAALSRLCCLDKRPLVLIKHTVYSTTWDLQAEPLIEWYMNDYWGSLECGEDIPLFLVFFKIRYEQLQSRGWRQRLTGSKCFGKERIRQQLDQLCRAPDEGCPRLLLSELTAVEKIDVMQWLDQCRIYDEWRRKQIVEKIFTEENRALECRCMADVERELQRFVEEYQREELI